MKRKLSSILSFASMICLSSCYNPGKRTNYIVSGTFDGVNDSSEDFSSNNLGKNEKCCLKIEEISEDYFKTAKGKNVIKDEVRYGFYSIVISKIGNEKTWSYDFLNFKDAYKGATGTPISYKDDKGCWLTPWTNNYQDKVPSYNLSIGDQDLFCYLYLSDNS